MTFANLSPREREMRDYINERVKHVDCGYATPCWVWQKSIRADGYGQSSSRKYATRVAHRIAYEAFNGPIPEGLVTDHLCRNRACVNPDHLEAVTNRENIIRGELPELARRRILSKTHCPSGHPYAGENLKINKYGARVCHICRKKVDRESQERRRAGLRAEGRIKLLNEVKKWMQTSTPRTALMILDSLIDGLCDELAEDLWDALSLAFTRAEEKDRSFAPIHPGNALDFKVWKRWRADRDAHLTSIGILSTTLIAEADGRGEHKEAA